MQINKMTPETLNYIATCANESEHASVRKLSCADVRGLLAEHAALVAVAESGRKLAIASCYQSSRVKAGYLITQNEAQDTICLANLYFDALANLAAVREGKAVQS